MRSLGRLVRGLSALFWGLPVAFLVCVYTAKAETLRYFGILPPLAGNGMLVFGLWALGGFQRQERIWRSALDRARVLGLVNFGLSPFLYWSNKIPGNQFFLVMVMLMAFCGLLLLGALNLMLQRLSAMLPDETRRLETNQFTAVNLNLLGINILCAAAYVAVIQFGLVKVEDLPRWLAERDSLWLLTPLVLLPLAMTMALLWKTKEVILDNVFGPK